MNAFQFASDWHIEYQHNPTLNTDVEHVERLIDSLITPTHPTLILAGDIGSLYQIEQLSFFLSRLCTRFKHVLYVPGNHEYYTVPNYRPIPMGLLHARAIALASRIPNLTLLDRKSVEIGGVRVIGCTLWSHHTVSLPRYMSIYGMTNQQYRELYIRDFQFITDNLDGKIPTIVVTHHAPSYRNLPSRRRRTKYASLYASHLESFFTGPIHAWISGHTHYNVRTNIGNVQLLSNQRGKPRDKHGPRDIPYSKTQFVQPTIG